MLLDAVIILGVALILGGFAAVIYANRLRLDADGDGEITLKDAGVVVNTVQEEVKEAAAEVKQRAARVKEEAADVAVAVKAVAKQAKGVAAAAKGKPRAGRKKKK